MGKSQRAKGVRGELEIAHMFQDAGFRAKRGVGQWQSASTCPDVILDDLPQYWIEVKRGAQTRPLEALEQATEAIGDRSLIPVAICRNDGGKAAATMWLIDWLRLVEPNPSNLAICAFSKVIVPIKDFMEAFGKYHADKKKKLPIPPGDSAAMAGSPVRTSGLPLVDEQDRDIETHQRDLFRQND